jgi:hypothetical protein
MAVFEPSTSWSPLACALFTFCASVTLWYLGLFMTASLIFDSARTGAWAALLFVLHPVSLVVLALSLFLLILFFRS